MNTRLCFSGSANETEIQEFTKKHLHTALAKFAHRISHVKVTLRDGRSANAAVDKVCRIDVKLHPHGFITTSHEGDDFRALVMATLHKTERAVGRQISRTLYGPSARGAGLRNVARTQVPSES